MDNYYKYFPVSEQDENWGLTVMNVGCTRIGPTMAYPHINHPAHHYFDWGTGRVLHEYQVIYITKGEGLFESERGGSRRVTAGTIILLLPEERHRYKPYKQTGWDEFWVGFKGIAVDKLFSSKFFSAEEPTFSLGFDEKLLNLFIEIINIAKVEKAGYQPLISGMVLHILGHIYSHSREDKFEDGEIAQLVNKARLIFRTNTEEKLSPKDVANELHLSYSRFRKLFKEYTGMAPGQFQIQLKIQKAKELLMDPDKTVKEIAYELNFESNFYFSKLFKEKTGVTPGQYRVSTKKKYKKK